MRAAAMYTLIVAAKLNNVDSQALLADVLARIAELRHTRGKRPGSGAIDVRRGMTPEGRLAPRRQGR